MAYLFDACLPLSFDHWVCLLFETERWGYTEVVRLVPILSYPRENGAELFPPIRAPPAGRRRPMAHDKSCFLYVSACQGRSSYVLSVRYERRTYQALKYVFKS